MNRTPIVSERRPFRMRLLWLLIGAVILAAIAMVTPSVRQIVFWRKWVSAHSAVCDKIAALTYSRPDNVNPDSWREAVYSTRNLVHQVYFSPSPEGIVSLRRLEVALNEKVQREVNLNSLRWIWDEIQADNPNSRYPVDFWDDRLFGEPPITDDSVLELRAINRRCYLDLTGCAITDTGLQKLEGLSNLEAIMLSNTQVTDEGVARLQRALPDCQIER